MNDVQARGGLPVWDLAKPSWASIWYLDAYTSTAIDGNGLRPAEVEALLDEGRAVGGRALQDYLEVLDHAEAAAWVFGQAGVAGGAPIITLDEVRELHRLATARLWFTATPGQETPAGFRQRDVPPVPGVPSSPPFAAVPDMMEAWVSRVNQVGAYLGAVGHRWQGPRLVGACHAAFERIHPFADANGRTGRLVLNLIMVRLGWPPVVVTAHRRRYETALLRADAGDVDPLAEMIAQAAITSVHVLFPDDTEDTDLLPLSALADETMSLPALRQAVTRRRLEATLDRHGVWRTTRAAVDAYRDARYQRAS